MLYYLHILLRRLYYCSIQELRIRLSCARWSTNNRESLSRFCNIWPVLVWLNPGEETGGLVSSLDRGRWWDQCTKTAQNENFLWHLLNPCTTHVILNTLKFLNWLYDRRAFSPLHGPGADQQHLAVSQIHYVCTHLCNCKYVHMHMHSVYQYTARISKARLSAIYNITLKPSATKNVIWHLIAFSQRFCFFPLIFRISTHLWLQTVYILHSLTVFP